MGPGLSNDHHAAATRGTTTATHTATHAQLLQQQRLPMGTGTPLSPQFSTIPSECWGGKADVSLAVAMLEASHGVLLKTGHRGSCRMLWEWEQQQPLERWGRQQRGQPLEDTTAACSSQHFPLSPFCSDSWHIISEQSGLHGCN